MSDNGIYSKWSNEYVDIHGRNLRVMVSDDDSIFIPLHEVKKSGFHIFPRKNFDSSLVGKNVVLGEFQKYMLGVGRKFLIQNSIASLTHEDIIETIEMCRQQLLVNEEKINKDIKSSGALGRTLLADPAEINHSVKAVMQQKLQQRSSSGLGARLENRVNYGTGYQQNDSSSHLRPPHQQRNSSMRGSNSSIDSNKGRNLTNGDEYNRQNGGVNKNNYNNRQQQNKSFPYNNDQEHKFAPSDRVAGKRETFKPGSQDAEYIRMSDCNLQRVELQKTPQDVKVVHVDTSNGKEKYWVQLVEHENIVMDMTEKFLDLGENAPVATPELGEMYLAMCCDGLWNRVIVLRISPAMKVHFIDFGNDGIVSEVRQMPEEFRQLPAQAVRITVSKAEGVTTQSLLKVDQIASIRFMKQFTDTTNLVTLVESNRRGEKSFEEVKREPMEAIILDQIKYSTALTNDEAVKIIAYSEGRLYLRNRAHHEKLRDIVTHINNLSEEQLKNVVIGQAVLSKKNGEEQLCRAIVKNISDRQITVEFMDFKNSESVQIKNLYGISKAIANLPVALIKSPQIKGCDKFNEEAESLIDDMITGKVKLNVVLRGEDFDLTINGKSLSDMLIRTNKELPPNDIKLRSSITVISPEASKTNVKSETASEKSKVVVDKPKPIAAVTYVKTTFDDLKTYLAPTGIADYMMTAFKDQSDFTITSSEDKEQELLTKCTCIDIDDEEPYQPVETEMVLAYYEDGWYRGAVLDELPDERYNILFVDYGNLAVVGKKDVRKFPQKFKQIPMMGLQCRMEAPDTEAVTKRLGELLKLFEVFEIDVVSFDADNCIYTVEIPKIKAILNQEGLL